MFWSFLHIRHNACHKVCYIDQHLIPGIKYGQKFLTYIIPGISYGAWSNTFHLWGMV